MPKNTNAVADKSAEALVTADTNTIQTPAAAKKADLARAIFAESYAASPVPARKDILARAQAEAGLTKAGSATYLQNYRNAKGMVTKREAATA
jgi:hypothetical protein